MFGSIRISCISRCIAALALAFSLTVVGPLEANDKDPMRGDWSAHTDQWLTGVLSIAAEFQIDPLGMDGRLRSDDLEGLLTPEVMQELRSRLRPYLGEIVQIRSTDQAVWYLKNRPEVTVILLDFLDDLEAWVRHQRRVSNPTDDAIATMASYSYQVAARMAGAPVAP